MDFYLINLNKRYLLYTEQNYTQENPKENQRDRIEFFIKKLAKGNSWWKNFLSGLIRTVRDTYFRLEDKIDPMERIFKRMGKSKSFKLFCSAKLKDSETIRRLNSLLIYQRRRHAIWLLIDTGLAIGALGLTPFLVPIPGPNIFLYFPALRAFSHYLACQGITNGLRLGKPIIINLDKITNIESLIAAKAPVSSDSRISQLSRELGLEKLDEFIGKYSS